MKRPPAPTDMTPEQIAEVERQILDLFDDFSKVIVAHSAKGVEREHIISALSTVTGQTIGRWVDSEKVLKSFVQEVAWGIEYQAEAAFKARSQTPN